MSVYTYSEAARIMESARDPQNGKPLQNNTRMYLREWDGERSYAIRLHSTDVVTIRKRGAFTVYELHTGGWDTVTTRDRITTYAPVWRTLGSRDGEWALTLRPDPEDPEPEYGERAIPKPFKVADPGPEPVKSSDGCWVGQRHVRGTVTHVFLHSERDLRPNDRLDLSSYTRKRIMEEPTRARRVLRYLREIDRYGSMWDAKRPSVERIIYREECHGHYVTSVDVPNGWTTKQCPHCAAFSKLHSAWYRAMHGTSYGRNSERGYRQMCEMLDEHGSYEEWQAAYIEDFRRAREQRKVWKAWDARNHIAFFEGITVDADGYPLKAQIEERLKELRKRARAQKRHERECERRMREEERKRRFIERAKRARRDPFVAAAENIVVNARSIGVRANESLEESDDD